MKKWIRFVALLTAVTLLAGCNLVGIDTELDAKQIVAKVGDREITKGEWHATRASLVDYYAYMYSSYGMSFDPTDETVIESFNQEALDAMIQDEVLMVKAKELGLDVLTEEETAEIEANVTEEMDLNRWYYQMMFYPDGSLEDEETAAAIDALLAEDGYSVEALTENYTKQKVGEKLRAEAVKDVVVTDEEAKIDFDAKVESQKATYDAAPTQYAYDVSNGTEVYYIPEGYRSIKHVLIMLDSEKKAEIDQLEATLSENATTRASLERQLTDLTAEPAEGVELTAEEIAANEESIATINAQLAEMEAADAEANEKLPALKEAAYAEILPKAEMVLALAKGDLETAKALYAQLNPVEETATEEVAEEATEETTEEVFDVLALTEAVDFQTLIDEYNEDPGMRSEPYATTGYELCEGLAMYETGFQNAAMALENIGDVSEIVEGLNGYHILCYMGDVAAGAVDFETKKDAISTALLTTKQNDAYNTVIEQWVAEAKVETFPKAMKTIK
ncbi:MAG: SurA N-terminal domain-containing protein [Clostridia bacterium]|nr:SurA N-terminal domain-containing protein [Clostridia bacterium]